MVTKGRLTKKFLEEIVKPPKEAEFYVSGPRTFMINVRKMLMDMGVPQQRMHSEFFGPTPEF